MDQPSSVEKKPDGVGKKQPKLLCVGAGRDGTVSLCRMILAAVSFPPRATRSPALGGEQADLMLHWRGK
jgi:hypothetical protein